MYCHNLSILNTHYVDAHSMRCIPSPLKKEGYSACYGDAVEEGAIGAFGTPRETRAFEQGVKGVEGQELKHCAQEQMRPLPP
jgi:hypothetical protein